MPRFFVDSLSENISLTGENAKHILKALRMKKGEEITLCDGAGFEGKGEISEIFADSLIVNLHGIAPSESEPNLKITLYISYPKGDKTDFIVQKAVELGAFSLVFVNTEFCVAKPKPSDYEKKISRLQKIAQEAAGQSGRGIIPEIKGIISLKEAITEMKQFDEAFMLYEGSCPSLKGELRANSKTMALFTGCEGGFSKKEVDLCINSGIKPVSLGKRILRCETAPIATLAAILFFSGNME